MALRRELEIKAEDDEDREHGCSDVPCTRRVPQLGESGVFGVFLV